MTEETRQGMSYTDRTEEHVELDFCESSKQAQNRLLLELIELPGEGLVWVYVILEEEEGVPLSDLTCSCL